MARFIRRVATLIIVFGISSVFLYEPAPAAAQTDPLSQIASTLASVANAPPSQEEAPQEGPVVRAFMFTRVGCLHCDEAKKEILPPIKDMFGPQLDLRYVYSDTKMGIILYEIAQVHYSIDDPGVPMIIVGEQRFQGTQEIRDLFPAAVFGYLNEGGVDWPDMPGLEFAIAEAGEKDAAAAADEAAQPSPTDPPKPTVTVQPTATLQPTVTPQPTPLPTPTPAPSGRFGGCFGSIALGVLALGTVVGPRVRSRLVTNAP